MREAHFTRLAYAQYQEWKKADTRIFKRIQKLLNAIDENPFKGIGKPEPLKNDFKGYWSRRINHEHRLVYKVMADEILVIACKYHY